jgi:hypothetical protein
MQKIITWLIKLKDYWQIPSNLTTATFEGISKRIPSLFPFVEGANLIIRFAVNDRRSRQAKKVYSLGMSSIPHQTYSV